MCLTRKKMAEMSSGIGWGKTTFSLTNQAQQTKLPTPNQSTSQLLDFIKFTSFHLGILHNHPNPTNQPTTAKKIYKPPPLASLSLFCWGCMNPFWWQVMWVPLVPTLMNVRRLAGLTRMNPSQGALVLCRGKTTTKTPLEQWKKGPRLFGAFLGGWQTTQLCGDCFKHNDKDPC